MGEEETVAEAVEAPSNGTCQPEETNKNLAENKEIDGNGVKDMDEDGKESEKVESVKPAEENDSKEEKSNEEKQKEDVKADEGNDSKEEMSKEVEQKEDVKADEEIDSKEEKSKEVEQKENVKADEDNDSKEEKSKEVEQKEDVKADEENDSKDENTKEEEQEEEAKADKENDSKVEKESEKVEEKAEVSNDAEDKTKECKEEKEPTKRGGKKGVGGRAETKKKDVGEKDIKEPVTPVAFSLDRPVRERKSVERLVAVIEKEPTREFRVEKGRGTALKDIPNVAFKLKRKRTDETFKLLHVMLFGRKGKAFKNNLSQFSGFAWHENEEKQKIKIKEKLDKFVKEKLLEFCDVLDIRVARATTRKEEIVAELLEFLAAPHATTDVLLAETELSSKVTKRKRSNTKVAFKSGSTTAKRSPRKRRKPDDTPKAMEKDTHEPENESDEEDKENEKENENENENGVSDGSEDVVAEPSESKEKDDDSEEEKGKQKQSSTKSSAKKEASEKAVPKKTATPKKTTVIISSPKNASGKSSAKQSKVVTSDTTPNVSSRKKKEVETNKRKYSSLSKSATKEKAGKKVSGGKDKSKDPIPSEDELRNTICDILKEVDFNTATFTDILKRLAGHYDADLTPKKAAIKLMIQEELTKLADEEEENEDESESEKEDDPEPAAQKIKT